MATVTPSKATDSGTTPAPKAKVPPLGRVMVWVGLALGTAATVLAVMHGIRFPGLEVVLSVLVTWLLLIVVAVTVAELARRHHRAAARHAWRHGKRGALFAHHHTRRGTRAAGGYLTAKAAARWAARQHQSLDPGAGGTAAGSFTPVLLTARSTTGRVLDPVTGQPVATVLVHDPDDLKRRLAAVARYPDIEVSTRPADPPGNESNPPEGTTPMTDTKVTDDTSKTSTRAARRARNSGSGAIPAEWAGVIARAADCEPENDGELLGWMGDEVNGAYGYAESLIELLETCTSVIGLDPVAMAALHDVADAATECAATMAAARHRFADHYELPREFAGNGGLMPHDGRWVTGDGDA
jgi:hypothetical protein